jgi:hypothetical protein
MSQAEIIGSVDEGKKFLAINGKSPRADAIKSIFQREVLISGSPERWACC